MLAGPAPRRSLCWARAERHGRPLLVASFSIYEVIGKGKHSSVYKGRKKKTIIYYAIKSVEKSQKPRVLQEVGDRLATTAHLWLLNPHHVAPGAHDACPGPPQHPQVLRLVRDHQPPLAHLGVLLWRRVSLAAPASPNQQPRHLFRALRRGILTLSQPRPWPPLLPFGAGDLMSLTKQDVKLPESSIHDFARDLVVALQYLHSHSIIYCDLKPSNILLDENGRIKLGGFGLSRRLQDIAKEAVPQAKRGTPAYMVSSPGRALVRGIDIGGPAARESSLASTPAFPSLAHALTPFLHLDCRPLALSPVVPGPRAVPGRRAAQHGIGPLVARLHPVRAGVGPTALHQHLVRPAGQRHPQHRPGAAAGSFP